MWIKNAFYVDNVDNFVDCDKTGIFSVDKIVENEFDKMSNWGVHLLTGDGFHLDLLKSDHA